MKEKNEMNMLLESFVSHSADIQGALVATADGITIANARIGETSSRIAAMASAAIGLGRQMISTTNQGRLTEMKVSGDSGHVFIYSIAGKAVLVVTTKDEPNIAMVNWEAQRTVRELETMV